MGISEHFRYLLAGAWNLLFGYSLGVALYLWLNDSLHTVFISMIANVLSISMSFLTYKVFVFRTRGNWIQEYIKCYFVYGSVSIVNIFLLWFMVDGAKINVFLAQGFVIFFAVIISFLMHKRFTFKQSPE